MPLWSYKYGDVTRTEAEKIWFGTGPNKEFLLWDVQQGSLNEKLKSLPKYYFNPFRSYVWRTTLGKQTNKLCSIGMVELPDSLRGYINRDAFPMSEHPCMRCSDGHKDMSWLLVQEVQLELALQHMIQKARRHIMLWKRVCSATLKCQLY